MAAPVKFDKEKDNISMGTFSSQANLADKIEPERAQWGNKWEFMLACIGYAVGLGNVWRFPWLAQKNGGGGKEDIVLLKQFGDEGEGDVDIHEPQRDVWGNKWEFMLACIGYAVGLGNVWRFPWLAQKNGGGAFLIPYFIMLLLEGIPLFYLELSIGQRLRLGPIPIWKKVSPWGIGIGYGQCIASFLSSCFYNVVIAWCMYYLFVSMASPLPYHGCPDDDLLKKNITTALNAKCNRIGSTQYYWYYEALQISDDISDQSGFAWKLTMCLLCAWVLVALCMWKGIQTTGKVVYFTATFPYVILLVFIVQGFLLEGFDDGLKFFFVPKWEKLKDINVWMEAAAQIFFSLSLSFGGLIAYASYNDEKNNTLSDALIISFTNCGTSVLAGTAIFSILGYRANKKSQICMKSFPTAENCTVEYFLEKDGGGSGLAFVAFTEAIKHLPAPTFFSIVFFLMLITLGLGSMFGSLEGLVTSLRDLPYFQKIRKELIIVFVAVPGFLAGLGFTQYSGEYLVQLFNTFSVDIPILVVALCELIFVPWVYGLDKFSDDIEYMTGRRPPLIFRIMWKYISPLGLAIVLVFSLYNMMTSQPQYDVWDRDLAKITKAAYPAWALGIGISIFVFSFLFVPGGMLLHWYKKRKNNYSME